MNPGRRCPCYSLLLILIYCTVSVSCCVCDRLAPPDGWVAVMVTTRVYTPAGVPFATGGGDDIEPPLQPALVSAIKAESKTVAANTGDARDLGERRVPACLQTSIDKKARSSANSQRICKRFEGCPSGRRGQKGMTELLVVVLTPIARMAGAVCVTVSGEAGTVHIALDGAWAQVAVAVI